MASCNMQPSPRALRHAKSRPNLFALLPDDILASIFTSKMSHRSLCAICRVCHRFHQMEASYQEYLWHAHEERKFGGKFPWRCDNVPVTLQLSGWKHRYAYICARLCVLSRPRRGKTLARMGAWIEQTFEFHLMLIGAGCESWRSEPVKIKVRRDTCFVTCSDAAPLPTAAPSVDAPSPPLELEYSTLELHATRRAGGPSVRVLELPMPSGPLLRRKFSSSESMAWTARVTPQWAEEEVEVDFSCSRSQGWVRPTRSSPPSAACLWRGMKFFWQGAVPDLFVALHARLLDRPGMDTCLIRTRLLDNFDDTHVQVSSYKSFLHNLHTVEGHNHYEYIFERV